jgi:osmotically-inducible protein OsmY
MKKQLLLLASTCLLMTACENKPYNADNTGRNVRDRSNQAITAGEQSENEADRTITQQIRQALMDDGSLSTNGKNVKIITTNGVVTLRGPVNSGAEKEAIGRKASSVAGVKNVDNQLEIIRTDNAGDRE